MISHFPGLNEDGMTITYQRDIALSFEDAHFIIQINWNAGCGVTRCQTKLIAILTQWALGGHHKWSDQKANYQKSFQIIDFLYANKDKLEDY